MNDYEIKLPDDINFKELIQKVYQLSKRQGFWATLSQDKPLLDEDIENILSRENQFCRFEMDYVHGRSCKFFVYKRNDGLYINNNWYDHTNEQFLELLKTFNINAGIDKEHGKACACSSCRPDLAY